jgi:hypothetical protein
VQIRLERPATTALVPEPIELSPGGMRIPLDPGQYTLHASAPGYVELAATLLIGTNPEDTPYDLPDLVETKPETPAPVQAPGAVPTADRPLPSASLDAGAPRPAPPVLGYVIGGAGVLGLAAGGVFGGLSLAENSSASSACGGRHSGCPPQSVSDAQTRDTYAWVANVALGAGAVGVVVGGILVLSSRSGPTVTLPGGLRPAVGVGQNTLSFSVSGAL